MKQTLILSKILIVPVLSLFCLCSYTQTSSSSIVNVSSTVLPNPDGVYHDNSRIISFSGDKEGFIILKTYYGWYYDSFYQMEAYPLSVNPLELNNGLYTRYWKKSETGNNESVVFWKPCTNSEGITIIPPVPEQEIFGYAEADSFLYRIRYWLVSVPFTEQKAMVNSINTDNTTLQFEVDKYITIGSSVYTCVNGRGVIVRNYEKISMDMAGSLGFKDIHVSEDGAYMAMGEPEYTVFNEDNLETAIMNQNSKRKPPRAPPFTYLDLNFYYDEIERLRK